MLHRVTRSLSFIALLAGCGAPPPPQHARADAVELHDEDRDGAADEVDRCPRDAEDRDGVADDDGCPEEDADEDRIADAGDRCPLELETYNGIDDEDGCPDEGAAVVVECGVPTTERVYFAERSDELRDRSRELRRALADTITANPQLGVVERHGHADPSERSAERLARARAEAVRGALVSLGVDPARLAVHAHGSDDPMTAGRSEDERAHNRRVELRLAPTE